MVLFLKKQCNLYCRPWGLAWPLCLTMYGMVNYGKHPVSCRTVWWHLDISIRGPATPSHTNFATISFLPIHMGLFTTSPSHFLCRHVYCSYLWAKSDFAVTPVAVAASHQSIKINPPPPSQQLHSPPAQGVAVNLTSMRKDGWWCSQTN